jgi:Uncharacterised nucleotidyltransferase
MISPNADPSFRLMRRKVMLDHLAAEIAGAFGADGIETIVLKGPVLAQWLYPGELRQYCDSDLMVAPERWAQAAEVLERMGFRSWVLRPLFVDPGGTDFRRGEDVVDLHHAIPGLFGDPSAIWASVRTRSERQLIGGAELCVPDRTTVLMHVALHAGHHANLVGYKPFEDLRRAIACTNEQQWQQALDLAREYDGIAAFTTGLELLPEGRKLARRLELAEVRLFRYRLRLQDNLVAEEVTAMFSPDVNMWRKLTTVASEIFPQAEYMRWWSPLARRGRSGLAIAYVWRPLWAIGQLPGALRAIWRARRDLAPSAGTRSREARRDKRHSSRGRTGRRRCSS